MEPQPMKETSQTPTKDWRQFASRQMMKLLCDGYLRRHMTEMSMIRVRIRIDDIAGIVYLYLLSYDVGFIYNESRCICNYVSMGSKQNIDSTITCRFRCQKNETNKKGQSFNNAKETSVVVRPFVSQLLLFNSVTSKNDKNDDNNDKPNTNTFKLNFKLTKCNCNHEGYRNDGHLIQFGLIRVPNTVLNKFKTYFDEKYINKLATKNKNENEKENNDIKINNEYDYKKYFIDQILTPAINKNERNLHSISVIFNSKAYDNDLNIKTMMKDHGFEGHYMSFYYRTDELQYSIYYNGWTKMYAGKEYQKETCLALNDSVDMCIDYQINNKDNQGMKPENIENANLYFVKNDVIMGKMQHDGRFQFHNGKVNLDFSKYDYLVAAASATCDCDDTNLDGFQIEIL